MVLYTKAGGGGGNAKIIVKGYSLRKIVFFFFKVQLHSMLNIVNNNGLHISNWVRE